MTEAAAAWPPGGDAMAVLMRRHDWRASPLGPTSLWPERLRAAVEGVLALPIVASLVWGRDRCLLYNSAAAALYGDLHPAALGQPLAQSWPEEYRKAESFYDRAFAGEAVHVPAQPLDVAGNGGGQVFEAYLTPVRDNWGAVAGVKMIGFEVGARFATEAALAASEARQRTLVEGLPQIVWTAGAPGRWTWASPQWTAFTGMSVEASLDRGWLVAVHPEDRAAAEQRWAEAEARGGFEVEYRLFNVAEGRYRWFQTRARPRADSAGRVAEWFGTSTDVDDLRRLREHERLLRGELQHRVRNTLAIVRSIVRRTAAGAQSVDEYQQHLDGRLGAFSRMQAQVTRDPTGVDLRSMIMEELLAHLVSEGERVTIEGPDVRLQPRVAIVVSFAVHELVTNALKYGALADNAGRLSVCWTLADGALSLRWTEHAAIADAGDADRGFGRELLEASLAYELDADVDFDLTPQGLRYRARFPVALAA